jgi:hypothetical protein
VASAIAGLSLFGRLCAPEGPVAFLVSGIPCHAEIPQRFVGQGIQLTGEEASLAPAFQPQAERICHVHDEISFLCWQNSPNINEVLSGNFHSFCLDAMILWQYSKLEKRVILTVSVRKSHI